MTTSPTKKINVSLYVTAENTTALIKHLEDFTGNVFAPEVQNIRNWKEEKKAA